jgi:cytochrome c
MFTSKRVGYALLAFALGNSAILAEDRMLGTKVTEPDIKSWDITILPDGSNLPPGKGTFAEGAKIYAEKCMACHGENGKGGPFAALVSDAPIKGIGIEAPKTIKNFWANATTVFDYIRRAMPWPQPRTLSDEEVYALVAYILGANKIIDETAEMNAQTLPKVRMPNRDNFITKFPDRI